MDLFLSSWWLNEFVGTVAIPTVSQEMVTLGGIVTVLVLLLLSAFFASSEIAIFSLGDHRIRTLVNEGVPGAETLAGLKSQPRRLLVTILVGNNIVNIAMSSISTGLLGLYFAPGEAVLIATFGITSLVMLFGESAPKAYAVEHSESWSLRIARPLRLAQYGLYPLVEIFERLTRYVNKLMGAGDFEMAYATRSEVRDMVKAAKHEGVFSDEEHRMLQRLLRFRNRITKEAMVPRLDVVGLPGNADLSTAIEISLDSGFTQFPVYENTLDTVTGIVHLRDLLEARHHEEDVELRTLATEPLYAPETKELDELLTALQDERRRFAVVVDEFGTTAGIVTIEDIVEEIIGEVLTETEPLPIQWIDENTALVRGEQNIHVVNQSLGISLPETGAFESVAGLLLHQTGQLPEEGETVTADGISLVVETVENNRILDVRVELGNDDLPAGDGET